MRLILLALLLFLARAQDNTTESDSPDTADADTGTDSDSAGGGDDGLTPASDTGTPTTVIDMPPTLPSGPWNITYFIAPTRNNYWVNDNVNTAAWAPINVATNLILANSNASILSQPLLLVQNLAPGTANYKAQISNLLPSNNYILWLTLAGNPDQKLAQTQGFHIKPNSTAAIKQVTGASPGAAVPANAPGTSAPGSPGSPGAGPGAPGTAPAPGDPAAPPADANPGTVGTVSPSAAHKAAFGGVLAGVAAVVGMVFGVL